MNSNPRSLNFRVSDVRASNSKVSELKVVGRLKRYEVFTKSTLIYIVEHNFSPKA